MACACGRSRADVCDGSHALTEEQWAKVQAARATDQFLNEEKDIDDTHNTSNQGG